MAHISQILDPQPPPISKKHPNERIAFSLIASVVVALLGVWILVTSSSDAFKFYMINKNHVETSGRLMIKLEERPLLVWHQHGRYKIILVEYKFTDLNGKAWRKTVSKHPFTIFNSPWMTETELLYNPRYPHFSAAKFEIAELITNYKLAFVGLLLLAFSAMIAYYAYLENRILKRKQKHAARLRYARSFNE